MNSKRSTVDPDRYVGTVTFVSATIVHINLPGAVAGPERRALGRGAVGDFIFIDCELVKILGRIIEIRLPDSERLSVEPVLGEVTQPNPIGKVQLLATVEEHKNKLERGLRVHPRIGDAAYLTDHALLGELLTNALAVPGTVQFNLGRFNAAGGVDLKLPPEALFGRHCGVFGATGGGKSWSLATIINEIRRLRGKAIIFDPTGEFSGVTSISRHYAFANEAGAEQVYFSYENMTEEDLFVLFRPSGQSQGPRLREAIRSLKLVRVTQGQAPDGVRFEANRLVEKRLQNRDGFNRALRLHAEVIHNPHCQFAIGDLPDQIQNECVYATGQGVQQASWGNTDQAALSYCESLIARMHTLINSPELRCLFGNAGTSLTQAIDQFIESDREDIIRISFKSVRFEHNTREILMNVMGRYLLGCARQNKFLERPMIVMLDEAHQFLGRVIGDEYASVKLDAFGLIAKEGRKYGLSCVLATQRPRDIPIDVLSQLGTLIVHRLTNDQDRETVEKACGDLDRNAALFIPTLAPGEAIIIGPDIPAPTPIIVHEPSTPPRSQGPGFSTYWRARQNR